MTAGELTRLQPTDGARFLFELEAVDGERARYRAAILTPTAIHPYAAVLGEDGAVELTAQGEAAADELATMLGQIGRLTARAAAGKRAGGLPPWPHRVLRWRGPGR